MYFLVSKIKKIIFGWSAKCGCSKLKRIFYYLEENLFDCKIHIESEYIVNFPNNINEYTIIIICRNPYKRLVSGFLDKYKNKGEFRHLWKHNTLTFTQFVDEIITNKWNMIEYHHFTKQTSESFDLNILKKAKLIKCFDIENIDYQYIENLYNKQIPFEIIEKKEGHERQKFNIKINKPIYNLDLEQYYNYHIDICYFYNEELLKKVYNFYKNDFDFFLENNIDYTNTDCILKHHTDLEHLM
jgi:hypothetical protein